MIDLTDMKNMLRKKSLERLASPEQLDRLLVIIRLPGWISLVCLLVLLLGILLWSIFARIPVKTEGLGVFFDPETIEVIQTSTDGLINKIYVKEGEIIKKGTPLILLKDPATLTKRREIEERIHQLEQKIELEKNEIEIELKQQQAILSLQQQRLKELKKAPNQEEDLYDLQVEMKKIQGNISLLENKLAYPEGSSTIDVLKKEAAELQSREEEMLIRAPADGRVLTINVISGEGVQFGKNLIWFQRLQDEDKRLVYSFFPIKMGSRIKPGMRAHIKFDMVQTERYGKMLGTVKEILFFEGGPEGEILLSIPSPALREFLSKERASVIVLVKPDLDSSTVSGFRWTTEQGPPYDIHPNSVANVEVFLEEKRPIEYLIPIGGADGD